MRYTAADDFGLPETAFLVCNFWYIDALAQVGTARGGARALRGYPVATAMHFGILSEDLHAATGELWGNFPQTYSMAGIINSAMRLSQSWEDALVSRLVIVSNRVTVPEPGQPAPPGGLAVAVHAALKDRDGPVVRLERQGRRRRRRRARPWPCATTSPTW